MALDWFDTEDINNITDADILAVEQKLQVKFPTSYIDMLKIHSGHFSEELEEMISLNQLTSMLSMGEYYCLSFMDENALKKVIPVFSALSGDFYALDYTVLNSIGEPTVIDVNHESDEGEAEDLNRYDSFEDFISRF